MRSPTSPLWHSLNSKHLARLNNFDRVDRSRDEGHEVLDGVAEGAEHDDSELSCGEILLELNVPISRHEDRKTRGFGGIEQLTVLQSSPRLLLYCSNVVPGQERRQLPRELLIEQNVHARLLLHGLLPAQRQPALSTRSETHPGIRRGCDCVRDNQSGS